jgi:Patatin-like phospholipase
MDPMLQLATKFLKASRPEHKLERGLERRFPEDIEELIKAEIEKLAPPFTDNEKDNGRHSLQRILWELHDERAAEILAEVFYANPEIARRLCEIKPDLCPGFIKYLVVETYREWRSEKARREWPLKREIHNLLMANGYDASETFPAGLKHCLLAKPDLVEQLADQLKAAVPFSLVLKKELDEISTSREMRLRPDPNASASKHLTRIYGIRTSLERLKVIGNDDQLVKEKEENERKAREQMWAERPAAMNPPPQNDGFQAKAKKICREALDKISGLLQKRPKNGGGDSSARWSYPPIRAEQMGLFGLALSGGGIRSATFNLGILQGMADLDLLRRVDYLSGVSGGAHIAGRLAAWIKREFEGIRRVQRWLSPVRSPTPDTDETHPIQFLRRFSNYLAPRKGFLSADVWSMLSVWLRNTVLNQIVFVLLLASVLSVPRVIFALLNHPAWFSGGNKIWVGGLAIGLTFLLALLTGLNIRQFDHGERQSPQERRKVSPLWNQFGLISTLVPGFWILGLLGASLLGWSALRTPQTFTEWLPPLVMFIAMLLTQFLAHSWRGFFVDQSEEETTRKQKAAAIGWTIFFSAISSFAGWYALHLGFRYYTHIHPMTDDESLLARYFTGIIVFGPAAVIAVLSLVIILQIGLMGRNLPDTRREWWSRLGATLMINLGIWTAISACALYGPLFVLYLWEIGGKISMSLYLIVWLAPTFFGSRWGFGAQTPAFPMEGEKATIGAKRFEWLSRAAPREWVARAAPYFYIAGMAILLSFLLYASNLIHAPALLKASTSFGKFDPKSVHYWANLPFLLGPWWLLPVMLGLAMLLAWRFDINEFSMHHFYRNRLVRCYLGASRAPGARDPNPFTGFDPEDDLRVSDLRVKPQELFGATEPYYGPLPIFNTTLNLVAGEELAWQERKAASFAFTPLYSGYELAYGVGYHKRKFANYGYRPTKDYAEPTAGGPSLGTAFPISGAAVNPSMGYHYSPALSFLMALFNIRLGCWLGNTRHRNTWKKASPIFGLPYLVNELIGNTNDTSRFINLSDGGHFDNLGLYELVRRRCMYIIVSDAEEDPAFAFGGLGNAIRKCRTDFGVDIRLDPDHLRPVPGAGRSRTHCATGEIIYSPETRGLLLYIKTSLSGDEPADVLEYKLRHTAFPHQSGFNQFFDESQFESYRALGKHTAMAILKRASQSSSNEVPEQPAVKAAGLENQPAPQDVTGPNKEYMSRIFHYLYAMWYPPTKNFVTLSDQHSKLYADLVDKFRSGGEDLAATAQTFFFRNSQKQQHLGSAFYVHALMIELIHRVFLDLELETMADHPHNEGWMNLFRDWAKDESFQKNWNAVQANYDIRFRYFFYKEFIQGKERRKRRFPWIWRAA